MKNIKYFFVAFVATDIHSRAQATGNKWFRSKGWPSKKSVVEVINCQKNFADIAVINIQEVSEEQYEAWILEV